MRMFFAGLLCVFAIEPGLLMNTALAISTEQLCQPGGKTTELSNSGKDILEVENGYLYCDDPDMVNTKKNKNIDLKSSCAGGTVVPIPNTITYRECVAPTGISNDVWSEPVTITTICDDSPIQNSNTPNVDMTLNKRGQNGSTKLHTQGYEVAFDGHPFCIWIQCQSNYFYNKTKKECQASSVCTNGGGRYDSSSRTCRCSKNTEEWSETENKCVLNDAGRQQQANQQAQQHAQQQAQTRTNREKCENSGGEWNKNSCTCSADKHLEKKATYECRCVNGYEFKSDRKICEITDVEDRRKRCQEAESKGIAKWGDYSKTCQCNKEDTVFNYDTITCDENPDKVKCNKIQDAKWIGGECVCTAAGKVLNEAGTACVDSAETVAANLSASLQRSRNEISGASSKIKAIKESFKKTVWKDEDGKFNTTRLASDSIAAVVLGTTGALVTSNVIKKNQVKNGFEDINCTVGGQKVAGWGDEFRVGIQ